MTPAPRDTEITSDKIATLGPTWARFPGLTVLFDEDQTVTPSLYALLAEVVGRLGAAPIAQRYGLCLLPPSTYHVTVCDGPNLRRRETLPPAARAAFDSVIEALPAGSESLARSNFLPAELECLRPDRLDAIVSGRPVTMRVVAVEARNHAVVAALQPADDASADGMEALRRERVAYSERLAQGLGLRATSWHPHVTVGYLANTDLARGAQPLIDEWNAALAGHSEATVTFTGAALYGFTDMANFVRLRASSR